MFSKTIDKILKNPIISSISLILMVNVFYNVITFLVEIFLAKKIGPEQFGVFSLAVTTMMMVNLITDLGFSLTMIRFYNLYVADRERQNKMLLSLLLVRLAFVVMLMPLSFPLGAALTRFLKINGDLGYLYPLAIISGGLLSLWVYVQNYYQALKKFKSLAVMIFVCSLLRIGCFIVFYKLSLTTRLTYVLGGLYAVPVAMIIAVNLMPIFRDVAKSYKMRFRDLFKTILEVLKYSKWVAISALAYNLILRLIQYILAIRSSQYELGLLSAGLIFTVAFSTLNISLRTVFFPHVTSLNTNEDIRNYFSKIRKTIPFYSGIIIISLIVLSGFQVLFLGVTYARSLPLFLITSAALSVTIFIGLWTMAIHTLMKPEVEAIMNILRLVAACLLTYLLSPAMGAMAGAIAYSVTLVLGEAYILFFVYRRVYAKI